MADTYDPRDYALRGLRRNAPLLDAAQAAFEAQRLPTPEAVAPAGPAAVDRTSEFGRGLRRGAYDLAASVPVLYGAGRNLVDAGSGDAAIGEGVRLLRRGEELGPTVASMDQVHDVSSGLDYAAGQVGALAPSLALTLLGGGVGGAAAKGLARRAATGAAERYAVREAEAVGARAAANGALSDATVDSVKARAASDALRRAAPRFAAMADEAAQPAVAAARTAGTVAGQYPSVVATSAEGAPDAAGNRVGGLEGASAADTAKILAGDLGAATIGALPELRLLSRAGGAAAGQAITQGAQRLAPRIATEAAKQGALGAGLGVAQTAAQFAAHKWVNDNVDLLSPAAFQAYLDTAVAGGVLGGGLGGAVEGAAALSGRVRADGTPNPQWDALKSKIREGLATAAQARDTAFTKARGTIDAVLKGSEGEGKPVQGADVPEGTPVSETPAKSATDAAKDIGAKLGEGAASLHKAAIDTFTKLSQHLSDDDARTAVTRAFGDAVDSMKERFDTAPLQAGFEAAMKSYSDALNRAPTPKAQADVQKAYGKVFEEHITDAAPDATSTFSDTLNRLQDDSLLDDRANGVLDRMSQRFESGEADALSPNDRSPTQNPARMSTKLQDQLATAIPVDSPLWSFPEAMKPLMASAEKLFTGAERTAADHRNIDLLRRYAPDRVDEWEAAGPRYAELSKGSDTAHAEADAADARTASTDALRQRILRDGGANGDVLVENRVGGGRDFWAAKDPTTNANTIGVGVRDVQLANGRTVQRQTALQLDNLVSKKLAEDPGAGPFNALKSVLGDLHEAGFKVQPETITPGTFYTEANGEAHALSPGQVRVLRASLEGRDVGRNTSRPKIYQTIEEARNTNLRDGVSTGGDFTEKPRAEFARGADDSRVPGPEFVPRKEPPSNAGAVDIEVKPSPYSGEVRGNKIVGDLLKTVRNAKGTERAQAIHEAGVKIGKAELAKELEAGTINGRRYAAELKRLDDVSTGLSRRYVKQAAEGKFDTGRVREAAAENAAPLKKARLAADAVRQAGVALFGTKYVKNSEIAGHIKTLAERERYNSSRNAERGPNAERFAMSAAEQKLLRVARDASDLLLEDHPYRVALEEGRQDSTVRERAPRTHVDTSRADQAAKLTREARTEARATVERRIAEQARELPKGEGLPAASEASRDTPGAGKAHETTLRTKEALTNEIRGKRAVGEENRLQDTIDSGVAEASKPSGKHDHAAEAEALNTVLKRMGISDRVTVGAHESSRDGSYTPGRAHIQVSDDLHGAERLEVLAHELGHHIIRVELARKMGLKHTDIAGQSHIEIYDLLAKHDPELHAAIDEDYQKWVSEQGLDTRYADTVISRKAAHRAEAMRAGSTADTRTLRYVMQTDGGKFFKYGLSFEEYVADQVARALTHSEAKTPVAKFFKGIADKLKLAYDTLFGGKGGDKYAPAPSVEKWVQSLFDRTTLDVSEALGRPVSGEQARTATQAALHAAAAGLPPIDGGGAPPTGGAGKGAAPGMPPDGFKALIKFIRYTLPKDARLVLEQALARGASQKALDRIYAGNDAALKAMRTPEHALEAKIAYAYMAWKDGTFTTGPKGASALRTIGDDLLSVLNLAGSGKLAERVFNDIENGRIERMVQAGRTYDVAAREAAYRGTAQQVLHRANTLYNTAVTPLRKAFTSSIDRMRATGVPAIRRVGALLQRHTGEAGEDPGLSPAVTHVTDRYMRSAGKAFEGLNDREVLHALSALQRQDTTTHYNPKVADAVKATRALFDQLYEYGKAAGLDIGKRENYFPVVLDIRDTAAQTKLRDLLAQPKFESAIRELFSEDGKPSTMPHEALIARLVGSVDDGGAGIGAGEFRAKNYRLMNFLYELGDATDKKTFAELQSKSPADIFARYVQPLVREAEFARRFGADGAKLEQLLAKAAKQGATPADIAQARAAVDGVMGRVGVDGSPTLRALFGDKVAEKAKGAGVRKGTSFLQAYQNARLLPLSVLSSLVDPMGIAVRTGGDFKTAWSGFKLGMKSLVDKGTKAELQGMLTALGSADDFLASDILSSNFGRGDGGARKINDFVFKANGLASWTRTTRFMALQAAHGFLVKHAASGDATSKRYLDELGVRAGDITAVNGRVKVLTPEERTAATPEARAADDRVRNGLLRFVDEAVLRPTSQQAPNWFADPYVGLVTQYKHFAYAIQDQIGRRIAQEVRHGNKRVLVPAMSYLPIIIMSEMLRGALQYGPGGNPNRKDWGPEEYTTYALDRSGLLGPRVAFQSDAISDAKHGNLPGASLLGPTAQQAQDVVRAASGRRSIGSTIENALPGEALFKHWNDGASP